MHGEPSWPVMMNQGTLWCISMHDACIIMLHHGESPAWIIMLCCAAVITRINPSLYDPPSHNNPSWWRGWFTKMNHRDESPRQANMIQCMLIMKSHADPPWWVIMRPGFIMMSPDSMIHESSNDESSWWIMLISWRLMPMSQHDSSCWIILHESSWLYTSWPTMRTHRDDSSFCGSSCMMNAWYTGQVITMNHDESCDDAHIMMQHDDSEDSSWWIATHRDESSQRSKLVKKHCNMACTTSTYIYTHLRIYIYIYIYVCTCIISKHTHQTIKLPAWWPKSFPHPAVAFPPKCHTEPTCYFLDAIMPKSFESEQTMWWGQAPGYGTSHISHEFCNCCLHLPTSNKQLMNYLVHLGRWLVGVNELIPAQIMGWLGIQTAFQLTFWQRFYVRGGFIKKSSLDNTCRAMQHVSLDSSLIRVLLV